MIIFAPADAFTLQWHYHYRHNCIFKPPRDAPLLQNPLAHHNTLPLGRRRGFPTRLDITLWEWIKHGHFPPLSLPFIDCVAETRKRLTWVQKALQNEILPRLACFSALKSFESTFSNCETVKFLTSVCHSSYWKEFDLRPTT